MKRRMKSEIRAEKTLGGGVMTVSSSSSSSSSSPPIVGSSSSSRNDRRATMTTNATKFRAADTTQDIAEQQFLCPKVHTDVEYDHELVKRMKVVNLNAMKCLKMPMGFARFFSYFNVGNIGNAGRVMNRTHAMRESFVCDVDRSLVTIGTWLRSYLARRRRRRRRHDDDDVPGGNTIFALNEKPVHRSDRSLNFRTDDSSADSLNFWSIFCTLKYLEPGVVVTVTQLRGAFDRQDDYFVNIRLTNRIPLIPVNVRGNDDDDDNPVAATYCDTCLAYYAVDGLTVRLPLATNAAAAAAAANRRDSDDRFSALPRCVSHIWCSRHELTLYELSERRESARPKLHEIACHGLLSVAAFPYATDISKLIVAINAHKRALELRVTNSRGGGGGGGDITEMRRYMNNCADRLNLNQNGKITRLFYDPDDDNDDATISSSRLTPRNAIKLLFAFGDVNLSNCEDGYVLSDRLRITAETTLCRRINFSCKSRVTFVSRMTLEYTNDLGLRVHVGTFISAKQQPVHFYNIGGNAQLYRHNDDDDNRYELYILWNASYVQLPFDECGKVDAAIVRRCRIDDVDDELTTTTTHDALLREEREYAKSSSSSSPVVVSSIVELHRRCVRVILRVNGVRQTLKLQNSFGQKGIAHYSDLSDFVTNRGESVDLVSSMYSLLGRFACGQLLEQRTDDGSRYIFSRRTGMCVGVGGYGYFFVSDDSAHNNFIYSVKHDGENPMRVCKLTYDSFLENNLSSSALVKASEFESGVTNPYAGIPRNVIRALDCYGVYDKSVRLESQTVLHTRRRLKDAIVLESIDRNVRRRRRRTADDDDDDVSDSSVVKKTRLRRRRR